MSRDYRVYLDDVIEAADQIESYISGLSQEEFLGTDITVDAVVRNLTVIGEAVKQLPNELRENFPEVDWQGLAGLRDVVTHQYWRVNRELIWDIASNELPDIREEIAQVLSEVDDN